jgi:hypothetical protein
MNTLKLEAPWADVKELMMEAEPLLTEEDLVYQPGEEDALIASVARKLNRSEEDAKGWIESVSHTNSKAS